MSLAAATAAVPEVLVVYPPPHRTHYLFANKLRVRVAHGARTTRHARTLRRSIVPNPSGLGKIGAYLHGYLRVCERVG